MSEEDDKVNELAGMTAKTFEAQLETMAKLQEGLEMAQKCITQVHEMVRLLDMRIKRLETMGIPEIGKN